MKMTNKPKIFIASFFCFFSVIAAMVSYFIWQEFHKIDILFTVGFSGIFAAIGALIAVIALPKVPEIEATSPKHELVCLRIGTVAGIVAALGGAMAWFGFETSGIFVAATGIIVGNIAGWSFFLIRIFLYIKRHIKTKHLDSDSA